MSTVLKLFSPGHPKATMNKLLICSHASLFQYGFQEAGIKTWQLGVDLTALLFLFCFFCDVLFSQLKIHLGSSWQASLSSLFSQILVFDSFCVFPNCKGLFASHFVTVTCVRKMSRHFPVSLSSPHQNFPFYLPDFSSASLTAV